MEWNKKNIDPDLVREISSRFNIQLLTAAILVRRGITDFSEIQFYLENDLQFVHNPFHFSEIEDAVDRILLAKEEGEKVLIYGDRDVDGITSTVIMVEELQKLGIEVSWAVPTGDETYGLSKKNVEEFAQNNGSLIITVDCGISNAKEIEYAKTFGIDTIVIDHHNQKNEIPNALSIINPKMEDEGYPFRDLAGCAVTAKVVWALEFAQTELYGTPLCLLNIRPGNQTYEFEAIKVVNLMEVDRIYENIVPGVVGVDHTRLKDFFSHQLFVYDAQMQERMLREIFGQDVLVELIDVAPELWKEFPSLKGKSLLQMMEISKTVKYRYNKPKEIDVLKNIFDLVITKKYDTLAKEYPEMMDLVALGTLADMMPLCGENRILVRSGLHRINEQPRGGLKELLFRQNLLGKTIGTVDIAWNISPLINATGRMGVPEKAITLFLSEDVQTRESLVEEIVRLNRERKKLGDTTWERILPEADKSFEEFEGKLVFVKDGAIHRGVTGIIASRLLKYFRTTSLVVSFMDDIAFGSLRSVKGFDVTWFLGACSEYFTDYGGHDFAAGFNMDQKNVPLFEQRVKNIIKQMQVLPVEDEILEIDAELPRSYVTPELIKIVEMFEPYGEGNRPLLFMCSGVKIADADIIGKTEKQHLRLLIDTGTKKWPAVYWNASERLGTEFSLNDSVDIVFRLGKNYYQNNETLQLTILDVKK